MNLEKLCKTVWFWSAYAGVTGTVVLLGSAGWVHHLEWGLALAAVSLA